MALLASVTRFTWNRSASTRPARSSMRCASASGGTDASSATNAIATQYQSRLDRTSPKPTNRSRSRMKKYTTAPPAATWSATRSSVPRPPARRLAVAPDDARRSVSIHQEYEVAAIRRRRCSARLLSVGSSVGSLQQVVEVAVLCAQHERLELAVGEDQRRPIGVAGVAHRHIAAGEPGHLDVDDVGQLRVGEPQDAEGSHHGGVRAVPHEDDLERDVGHLGGPDEPLELRAHDLGTADRAAQRRLVQHHPQAWSVRALQQALPGHPERDPALDLLWSVVQGTLDHRAHVVLGLQQAGHELALVGTDQGGRALQVDVGAEPGGQDVAVVLPPAGLVGLASKSDQARDLDGVAHAVEVEQVHQIALLEADLPVLQPMDLPLRRADRLPGLLPREAPLRAQPSELRTDQYAADGWSASRLSLGHVPASGGRWIRPARERPRPEPARSVSTCRWRLHLHLAECMIAHGTEWMAVPVVTLLRIRDAHAWRPVSGGVDVPARTAPVGSAPGALPR